MKERKGEMALPFVNRRIVSLSKELKARKSQANSLDDADSRGSQANVGTNTTPPVIQTPAMKQL